jgi:hypothetical protein
LLRNFGAAAFARCAHGPRAGYAGRVKFRAIKEGEDPASGYRDIDPLYFYVKPFFNWSQDVIFHREDESATVWYFVHLDREQFASLLRKMGVSVEQNLDPGAPQNLDAVVPADLSDLETSGTGLAGRPTSIQFILPLAQKRLDDGDYPDTKTELAKQLTKDFARGAPKAHHPKPKTLMNNAEFSEMWRRRTRKDLS